MTTRRDRKKLQTRDAIAKAAMRLFLARGFDAVTIADVAREADVAVQTVFNHFPTKEDLFFQERESYVARPAKAVHDRDAGVAVAHVLAAAYLQLLKDYDGAGLLGLVIKYQDAIEASSALRGRELSLRREREDLLAAALANGEPPLSEGLRPALMAAFATAVDRVLDQEVLRRLLAGDRISHVITALEPLAGELFGNAETACRQSRAT